MKSANLATVEELQAKLKSLTEKIRIGDATNADMRRHQNLIRRLIAIRNGKP